MNPRLWLLLADRLAEAPALAARACDALWLVILATEDTETMEAWARELHRLDGVSRHVPGHRGAREAAWWREVGADAPCGECFRTPCSMVCPRLDDGGRGAN